MAPKNNNRKTGFAPRIFSRRYQLPSEPRPLPRGLHRKKPQVAAIIAGLNVNASRQSTGIFRHQKRAAAHVRADSQVIHAIAVKDHLLHHKRRVDQSSERRYILIARRTDAYL